MSQEQAQDVLIEQMKKMLMHLSSARDGNFCGLGLIVYDTLSSSLHCDLRPHVKCPPNLNLGSPELNQYLLSISVPGHPLHDGFHFINKHGKLTHVAQYFVPNFVDGVVPNNKHGVRVHSAMCGSYMKEILLTGVVCSNGVAHLFRQGESINLEHDPSAEKYHSPTTYLDPPRPRATKPINETVLSITYNERVE